MSIIKRSVNTFADFVQMLLYLKVLVGKEKENKFVFHVIIAMMNVIKTVSNINACRFIDNIGYRYDQLKLYIRNINIQIKEKIKKGFAINKFFFIVLADILLNMYTNL